MLKPRNELDDQVTLASSRDPDPVASPPGQTAADAASPTRLITFNVSGSPPPSARSYEPMNVGGSFSTYVAAFGPISFGNDAAQFADQAFSPDGSLAPTAFRAGANSLSNVMLMAPSWAQALAAMDIAPPTQMESTTPDGITRSLTTGAPSSFDKAALKTTQPQQFVFTSGPQGVFGANTSFTFSLPSFLYQHYAFGIGASFAGFGLHAGASITGGIKGSVSLSLGQFTPDYPVTINPGVAPYVQSGPNQVFSIDPTLVSTNDAQFSLSLPQANASLDFGLQAQAGVKLSFPSIRIGVTLPFVGFEGYTVSIPSQSLGFNAGKIYSLPSNTSISIPGDGTVKLSELQSKVLNSTPQSAYGALPTLELSGNTDPFFVANTDLVSILAQEIPDPFAALQGSESFYGIAGLSYKLLSLPLSGSLWLNEDVKITPVRIMETVTDTLSGETHSGPLGSRFNFAAPTSGSGIIPLTVSFGLDLKVTTTLSLDGNIKLTLEGPSVSASILGASAGIGPLGNFNLLDLSGTLFNLYSKSFYETLTTTGIVDVQTFATPVIKTVKGKTSAVLLTKPGTDLVVTSTGTITGGIYGVETGTLSAALITDYGLIAATGNGVVLQEGGTVDVQTGGRITGSGSAAGYGIVLLGNTYDAVVNQGAITGFSGGVYSVGGSLKNEAGARIAATKLGVSITSAASVVNSGYIHAATAISLGQGGSLYNASGTIAGSTYGLYSKGVRNGILTYDPVSVENQGTITGGVAAIRALAGGTVTNFAGAYMHGGTVGVTLSAGWESRVGLTNGEGATISGGAVGVYLGGKNQSSWYTTLVDYGTISGGVAAAELYGLNGNTLVLGPDSRLSGGVRLTASAFNTVTLAAGNGDVGQLNLADLALVGTKQTYAFQNGRITFAPGASWVVSGNILNDYFSGLNAADRFDDSAIAFSAGERAVVYTHTNALNETSYVLSIRAAGNPTVSLGTIQFTNPLIYAPIVTAGASGGVGISFSPDKLTTVSANHGEVDISPTSFFATNVTIDAGVVVSSAYYGFGANQHYGFHAVGERATLTNYGTINGEVLVSDGGLLTNKAGATINGNVQLGARGFNANNTVTFMNAGTVTSSTGVSLGFVGTVINTGLINTTGLNAIYMTAARGTVFNQGAVTAGNFARTAVRMTYGGFVYNETGGLLTSQSQFFFGVEVSGGYGKVVNSGTISSHAVSVYLTDGGLVVNESGAISGGTMGVKIKGAAGDVANAALITGILLANGGTIINSATGTVTAAGGYGVNFTNTSGAVGAYLHNMGRIDGVLAFGKDTIVNDGTIDGVGIVAGAAGSVTITNSGVISGSGGTAVKFSSASDRLIAETGSQFIGALVGGGGVLELAGSGAESISGLGGAGQLSGAVSAAFAGFGSYVIDSGVAVTLTGPSVIAQGKTLIGNGAVTIGVGSTLQAYGVVEIGGSLNVGGAVLGLPGVNAPGGAGGQGVELLAGGVVTLSGAIRGGAGMNGNHVSAQGDAGGAGIAGPSSGTITSNFGAIAGGNGGTSYYYLGIGGAGGAGVSLGSGSVTNNGGTISGGSGGSGVSFYDRGGYGGAGAAGVILTGGGTVTNNGGAISGGAGGSGGSGGYYGGPGGAGGAGVVLGGVGTVMNAAGTISGGAGGGGGSGGNAGGPGGAGGDGVVLAAGGVVINGSAAVPSALISGATGVYAGSGGAATVTNFGTIQGLAGTAVQFNSTGDRLIAEAGSTWLGAVNGGGGALELAGGTGTITGLGGAARLSGAEAMTFSGFGSYAIDSGSSWTLVGGHTLGAGKTLTNAGTLNGSLALTAATDRLVLSSGSIINGRVAGGGGVLELAGGAGTIKGLGTSGTLTGSSAMTFSGFGSYVIDAGGSWILAGGHSLAASQTLTNAGTLSGALALTAASDRLIVASGSIVNGSVSGGGGVLELAGVGAINGLGGTGTLSGGAAMTFSGFGSYVIDSGASWTLSGANTLAASQTLAVSGSLINSGTITPVNATGIGLLAGGSLINNGAIKGTGATGVDMATGGSVYNAAAGLISGVVGVIANVGSAATVTNFGTIKGTGGTALQFNSVVDRLIAEAGSHFSGAVKGGGGTLELAGGAGTITGLGVSGKLSGAEAMTFSGFGTYAIDAGASWTLTGANTLAASQTLVVSGSLINSGTITPANATGIELLAGGSLINNGAIKGTGATGVDMATGGSVYNAAAGLISGVVGVIANAGSAATVTNFGTIKGTGGTALQFNSIADRLIAEAGSTWVGAVNGGGGTLELAAGSGTITGLGGAATLSGAEAMTFSGFGTYAIDSGASWSLTGANTLAASQTLAVSGSLTNSGTISPANATGIEMLAGGSLTNNGAINGTGAAGVDLATGGSINNAAAGVISGVVGVLANAGNAATVTNFGTIRGTGGAAVQFNSVADRLVAEAGSTWIGAVNGGGGMLELASGTGTITGLGAKGTISGAEAMTFGGFGGYQFDAGTSWTLSGANTIAQGTTLASAGTLTDAGTLTNGGTITGGVTLGASRARLIVQNGSSISGAVAGAGGTLELASGSGTITGLGAAGTISGGEAMSFSGFGFYQIDSGTAWTLSGTNTIATVVTLLDAGTLSNTGVLTGNIILTTPGSRLIVQNGSSITGSVTGGGGTLELAGGVGTLSGLGGAGQLSGALSAGFAGFGSYAIDSGAAVTLTGPSVIAQGKTFVGDGAVTIDAGSTLEAYGVFAIGGSLNVSGAVVGLPGVNAPGGAGGQGVELLAGGGVTVSGAIRGGAGMNGSGGNYNGAAGGSGIGAAMSGTITINSGVIAGGAGGAGIYYDFELGAGGAGGIAVNLGSGSVTNNGGTIAGGSGGSGVGSYDRGGNGGAGSAGVSLAVGGTVINNGGAVFGGAGGGGGNAGYYGGSGGAGGSGVVLAGAGTIINTGGTISGGAGGTGGSGGYGGKGGPGSAGATGDGVFLAAGGVVINGSAAAPSALISGATGVYAGSGGAATVTNFGTIQGLAGTAVQFNSTADRLIVEAGSTWLGVVNGGGGGLELAGGTGTITGLGSAATLSGAEAMTFSGFGTYQLDSGSAWTLTGTNTIAAGKTLTSAATLTNIGKIIGGQGSTGASSAHFHGGTGGAGAAGVSLSSAGASLNNSGTITGGAGGVGGYGYYGGIGGSGGIGVVLAASGASLTNGGTIIGGAGGYGGGTSSLLTGGGGAGAAAVLLTAAGSLTNTGVIAGGAGGAGRNSAGYALYPGGAGGAGVSLAAGGIVTNTGGTLEGGVGGAGGSGGIYGGPGGAGGAGLAASAGGTVINTVGAILGAAGGAGGSNGGGGQKSAGAAGDGILLTAGGIVINGSKVSTAALIEGLIGVYAGSGGAATVTNWGTIDGTGGISVQFRSSADRLIAEAGSTWVGSVQGGGGTLELAGGTGTITGLGATGTISVAEAMTFSGFGTYQLDARSTWALSGTNVLAAGDNLQVGGTLTIAGTLTNGGTTSGLAGSSITLKKADIVGGTLQSATTVNVSGTGNILDGTTASLTNQASLMVADKGALTIQGAIANSGKISLAAKTATTALIIGKAGATLSGGGSIVLGASAFNTLTGAATTATLTNVNNTIIGSGMIGNAKLVLVNQAGGVIDQTGSVALTINTGTKTIINAGTIEATGAGGATIASAIANTGLLEAVNGNLTVTSAVTGNGSAVINAGTMTFGSTFAENVSFSGSAGRLVLARSQSYTGKISGFSLTAGTSLDLRDIGFVSAGEATFSGTKTGGVLTVTDGTHTANIKLTGNYTTSTWTCSSDGAGGVIVVDPPSPQAPSPNAFATAIAGLGASAASAQMSAPPVEAIRPTLLVPRGA